MIHVYVVPEEGKEIGHKLDCEAEPCAFPQCPCAPREMVGVRLRAPLEPRVEESEKMSREARRYR